MTEEPSAGRSLAVGPASAKDFATPGRGGDLVQALFLNGHRRDLVRLARLRRRLLDESPSLVASAGFEEAFSGLRAAGPAVQHAVLSHPSSTLWLHVAEDLVRRGSHVRFPGMHARMHLEAFTRLAMAAAALRGEGVGAWRVRADGDGRVCLPGAGLCWEGGPASAREVVQVPAAPEGPAWRRVPLVGRGCELNALDEELRMPGRTSFSHVRLDDADVLAWSAPLDQAWEWIGQADPGLGAEMEAGVRAIVPVHPTSPGAHASATFREAPGLVALSRSVDAGVLAEALVHEYHHTKLNALLNVDPLVLGPHAEPAYYSPWRDDPRPLLGILHGAYTFQAILAFWCAFVDAGLATLSQERIHQRMHVIGRQALAATEVLRAHADLSELGEALVAAIEENVRGLAPRAPPLDDATLRRLGARMDDHRAAWRQAHPREDARMSRGRAARVLPEPLPPVLAELRAALALPEPGPDASRTFPPLVLDALLRRRGGEAAQAGASRLRKGEPGRGALEDLCAGHAAYVEGDFHDAARRYLHAARREPSHAEAWQLAAHALRRLSRMEDSRRLLAGLATLATLPPQAAPAHATLDDLLPVPGSVA